MCNLNDPNKYPWEEIEDLALFRSQEWTDRIVHGLSVYRPGTTATHPERQKVVADLLHCHSYQVLKRLKEVEVRLNEQIVDKKELIRMVIVSAIAQQPMLIVGQPGTAKSLIVNKFCEALGIARMGVVNEDQQHESRSFQYLLHGFTEPDEVLGVVDLTELQQNHRFRRIREGSIINAEVVFLDEVFKANSAILNALLTIINERRVYEGGECLPARARVIFGASNSTPTPRQLEELRAFYERFIIRMESPYTPLGFQTNGPSEVRRELLRQGWEAEIRSLRGAYDPSQSAMEPVSCLNDLLFCNRAVTELWGAGDLENPQIKPFLMHYHSLTTALGGGPRPECTIDDRKFIRLFAVVRAHSLFVNNAPPKVDDLCILKHIWDDLGHAESLAEHVQDYINKHKTAVASHS